MIKKLLNDNFIIGSSLLFGGLMVGNVFNYLFQITMGRLLSIEIYGEMNALFSTMVVLGVPFMALTNYLSKNVSHYNSLGYSMQTNDLIVKTLKYIVIAGIIIAISGLGLSKPLMEYLKIKGITPVVLLFLSISVSLIIPINTGILQGLQRFKMLSFLSGGLGVSKYIICLAFVLAGFSLNGIMTGIILSTILVGYISFKPVSEHLKKGREAFQRKISDSNDLSYIISLLIANISFTVLTQADIILVKHYFTPFDTGIYSSAAVIGKAVMYLPGAIVFALFPMVATNKAKNEGTILLLLKSLLTTLSLSGSVALLLYLFPDLLILFFFGKRYVLASGVIGFFALAMLPMAIVLVLMNYNLARGNKFIVYAMPVFAAVEIFGIVYSHNRLIDVLTVLLITGTLCMFSMFFLMAYEYYR